MRIMPASLHLPPSLWGIPDVPLQWSNLVAWSSVRLGLVDAVRV